MKSVSIKNLKNAHKVFRWFARRRIAFVALLFIAGGTGILFAARATRDQATHDWATHDHVANIAAAAASEQPVRVAMKPASTIRPMGAAGYGVRAQFALYDVGIYPRETRVKAGRVAISIEDYSGGTAGIIVERTGQGHSSVQVGIARREGQHFRGTTIMELEAGTYKLYATERPNNHAKLIVDP